MASTNTTYLDYEGLKTYNTEMLKRTVAKGTTAEIEAKRTAGTLASGLIAITDDYDEGGSGGASISTYTKAEIEEKLAAGEFSAGDVVIASDEEGGSSVNYSYDSDNNQLVITSSDDSVTYDATNKQLVIG